MPFVESTVSVCGIEEVARMVGVPPWFQLYVMRDRAYAEDLMRRATEVGSPVLVLTVDLPVIGARHRDTRDGLVGDQGMWSSLRRGWDIASHPRSVPSSVRALPTVVDAVGDQLEVLADGGARTGLDVVKMLALGAKAVLIGRAWAWGARRTR